MNYGIITSTDPQELVENVNKRLEEGWELHGNLVQSEVKEHPEWSTETRYTQVMVKE